ncbi:MAG TPA: hypothetical protein V6D30_14535 [Leptolyngbyaceae cyanobacterium]
MNYFFKSILENGLYASVIESGDLLKAAALRYRCNWVLSTISWSKTMSPIELFWRRGESQIAIGDMIFNLL